MAFNKEWERSGFQLLYDDSRICVYLNPSKEVFLENKRGGITLRIGDIVEEWQITCYDGVLTPWAINGLPAIRVRSKESYIPPHLRSST